MNECLRKVAMFVRDILRIGGTQGYIIGEVIVPATAVTSLQAISDGSFIISVDGIEQEVTGLDFSAIVGTDDILTILEGAIVGAENSFATNQFTIESDSVGTASEVSYMAPATGGTFIGAILGLSNTGGIIIAAGRWDEDLIKIGRLNTEFATLDTSYIAVDAIVPATRVAKGQTFDDVLHKINIWEKWNLPVTLSFFGNLAYQYADTFRLMMYSELGYQLQEQLGIAVYTGTQFTDIKNLTGATFNNRLDLNFNVHCNITLSVDALEIDTAQTQTIVN